MIYQILLIAILFSFSIFSQDVNNSNQENSKKNKTVQEEIESEASPKAKSNSSNLKYVGYSAFLPGLGEFKKGNNIGGSLIMGLFFLSAFNFSDKYSKYTQYEKEYRQVESFSNTSLLISILSSNNFRTSRGLESDFFLYNFNTNPAYDLYRESSVRLNQSIQIMGIVYIGQLIYTYFSSPSQPSLESKVSPIQFHYTSINTELGINQQGAITYRYYF
jgi:hypothetical protein